MRVCRTSKAMEEEGKASAVNGKAVAVTGWYLALSMVKDDLGQERTYRHTAPIRIYGFEEALLMVYKKAWLNGLQDLS